MKILPQKNSKKRGAIKKFELTLHSKKNNENHYRTELYVKTLQTP